MKTLPKIGRPSKSGLSVKELGVSEYHHRLWRMRHPDVRRGWSGLSPKLIGITAYRKQLRAIKSGLTSRGTIRKKSK